MNIIKPRLYGDGEWMPMESPADRTCLQEMCAGRIIARIAWDLNVEMPEGSAGFGVEFGGSGPVNRNYGDLGQGGERVVIMALPVTSGAWAARLIWRWLPAQALWTKQMRRHFGTDRVGAGEGPGDFLQRQIEGQMVRAVFEPQGHVGLGERVDVELTDGSVVVIEAIPTGRPDYMGRFTSCDLEVRRIDPAARVVIVGPWAGSG